MIITSQLTPDVLLREQRPRRRCRARCSTRTWVPTPPAATAARSTAAYPALCLARPRTPHRWPTSPREPLRDWLSLAAAVRELSNSSNAAGFIPISCGVLWTRRLLTRRRHSHGSATVRPTQRLSLLSAVAASLSPSVSPDNAGFMAGDNPRTDGGTWSEEYHSDPR